MGERLRYRAHPRSPPLHHPRGAVTRDQSRTGRDLLSSCGKVQSRGPRGWIKIREADRGRISHRQMRDSGATLYPAQKKIQKTTERDVKKRRRKKKRSDVCIPGYRARRAWDERQPAPPCSLFQFDASLSPTLVYYT